MRHRALFNGYPGGEAFLIAVALGRVPGWTTFRKFGANNDVPSTGSEEMWAPGTARVLPTTPDFVKCVSSSADDTDVSGIGGWRMVIEGLGEDYEPQSEEMGLNGTNETTSSLKFRRVNRAFVLTAGSNEVNVGDISCTIDSDLQAYLQAGAGQTDQTQYTVPGGHTVLINAITVGVGRMAGNTDLHVQTFVKGFGESWRVQSDIYLFSGGAVFRNADAIQRIPEKSEIKQIVTSTSTTQAHSIYQGFLVENRYLSNT